MAIIREDHLPRDAEGDRDEAGAGAAKAWFCLYTKPRMERRVHQLLRSQGVEGYLPELPASSQDRRQGISHPFFPRYLFARLALPEDTSWVRWTPGLVNIVNTDGAPIPIQDGVIETLREQVEALAETRAAQGRFRRGERVRITDGPFQGYEGVFDRRLSGAGRARILVQFLRRETPYEVETGWLAAADGN